MRSKSPLLQMIQIETVDELPINRVTVASDAVVETAPMQVESKFSINPQEILDGRFDMLYAAMEEAADSGLASLMPQFFKSISDVCDAAGQTINTDGELNHDSIMDALEAVEITFNDDESPRLPTLVMHPTTAEKLRSLPPPTKAQNERHEAIIEKKRRDWLARRRTRQLPRDTD